MVDAVGFTDLAHLAPVDTLDRSQPLFLFCTSVFSQSSWLDYGYSGTKKYFCKLLLVDNQEVHSRALFNHLLQYVYDYGNLLELVRAMANLVITSRIHLALSTMALGNLWLASPCMKETLTPGFLVKAAAELGRSHLFSIWLIMTKWVRDFPQISPRRQEEQ